MAKANKTADKPEVMEAADTMTGTDTTSVESPAAEAEETKKAEPKRRGRKPAAEKAEPKKRGRKPAAEKKETAAKTAAATTRKSVVKETVHVQFAGKTYSTEDLVKIAKDVWKYDLKRKVGDFKSVELYVKPEESIVYYVINGEETGHFNI